MTQSRAGWLCSHCGHIEATKAPLPQLPNQTVAPATEASPTEPFRAKPAPIMGVSGSDGGLKDEDLLAVDQILAKFGEHTELAADEENPGEKAEAKAPAQAVKAPIQAEADTESKPIPATQPEPITKLTPEHETAAASRPDAPAKAVVKLKPQVEPSAAKPQPEPKNPGTVARSKARAKGIAATDMHLTIAGITPGPETTFTGPSPVAALVPPPPPPAPEANPKDQESRPESQPAGREPEATLAPKPEPKPEPSPESKPEPKPEPKSEPEPALVPASPLGPTPQPLETPKPTGDAVIGQDAPAEPAAKKPLTPETHPKPVDHKTVIASIIAGFVLILVGLTAYFALATPGHPFALLTPTTPTPSPAPEASTTPSAAPSVTPTPTPAPTAATRDAERKTSFNKYLSAYRGTISNGFYAVTPPSVNVSQTDPTTTKAYVIATELPAASVLGTVYYLAGYQCTNEQTATKQATPGKTSTKYVALAMYLETTGKLFCQNINQ